MVAPISVAMIVRNEQHQLENCLKSIRPHVAQIIVVDTGSDDRTIEIAKKYADYVESYTECNDDQNRILRFDLARNRAFSHATQPWVMWIDGDDEVVGAEHLEALVRQYDQERADGPSMVMMKYEYSRDDRGNVTMVHERERLVTPKEHFFWAGWVHEVLIPKGADMRRSTDLVKIVHHRDGTPKKTEPGRNLRILRAQYEMMGDRDTRHLYYLGMECGNNGFIDEAIKYLALHVDRSGWDDERYMAAQLIANHYMNRGDYEKAMEWALKATVIHEDWGEAYFTLAKCCYFMAQRGGDSELRWWQRTVNFAQLGLAKPTTQTALFVNPMERDLEIHRYLNLALSKTGDVKGALDSITKALMVHPNDDQLKLNKRVFEDYLAIEEFKRHLNRLVELGKLSKEVRDFIETTQRDNSIPSTFQSTQGPSISSGNKLDIVFYAGGGHEAWNPDIAKLNGIGGSETAVIEMARRLASFGHDVRVYGDCISRSDGRVIERSFDGVSYLDHSKFKGVNCDVLISSRRPEAVDCFDAKWKQSILWVHDVHCGGTLNQTRASKFDRILTLSDWHRTFFLQYYPFVFPIQVQTTSNGIDLARFNKNVDRNPHRAVYSSSPDRGMQTAIDVWDDVRLSVPDAELHIYYGFHTWEAYSDEAQKKTISHLKRLIEEHKDRGVVFHGRIPQESLAEEMLRSGVWCYPTWFSETSCISAMEAQAAGLRIVTSPIAALNETVGDRGSMIAGDWLSADYKLRFTNAVVQEMLRPGDQDRKDLQAYASERFSWDVIAKEWNEMITQMVDGVLMPYQAA